MYIYYGKEKLELLMAPDELVLDMKKHLEEITGIPAAEQKVCYRGARTPFQDDKTFKFYGCHAGGFFDMDRKEGMS
jgi:hypothetical protein